MTVAGTTALAESLASPVVETAPLAVRRLVLWAVIAAKILALWGLQWDIRWHIRIGRDSAWIPPHLMMYSGVALIVLLCFGMLAWDTWRHRSGRTAEGGAVAAGGAMAVMGFVSTPGFHLAAWGIALTVLAAPIDDLWHRIFGIDVTLWSPPHLLGLSGSFINTAACLMIAREIYPRRAAMGRAAVIVSAGLLLMGLTLTAQQAIHVAYLHGGLAFHLFAILGTLVFPLAYLAAANLSGLRSAPLLVFIVSMALSLTGAEIARTGFEILQPVPMTTEEIAKDPTSPIAIAQAIAHKNSPPSRSGPFTLTQLMSLLPVLALAVIDLRRRPVLATVAYGITLLATMTWALSRSPAFAPLIPGVGVTLIALALTLLAALVSATTARWLSDTLNPAHPSKAAVAPTRSPFHADATNDRRDRVPHLRDRRADQPTGREQESDP